MARRPVRRPEQHRPTKELSPRAYHALFGGIGLVLLAIFFGGMIVQGSAPQAPDTVAANAISNMSYEWRQAHGEMPLWTPAVFSGMPSYGSMIYTHESIPAYLIGTLSRGNLGVQLLIYFAIAGACLYALLVRYGRSPLAAFFAAIVYVFTPYLPGLVNAGHNNKLIAAALIPPLLLVTDYLLRGRSLKAFAWFALITAWQLWARHPQVTYYGFMLIGCIVIADVLAQEPGAWVRARRLIGDAALVIGGLLLALGVVALPYLPVVQYTPESVRGGTPSAASELAAATGQEHDRSWEFATQWSMHPKELVTFAIPSFYGLWNDPRHDPRTLEANTYWGYMPFTQSTHYFGLIPLILALMVRPDRYGLVWGCIGFSVVALFLGLGHWFPALYWPAYKALPYFAQFRVPSMIYLFLPLSVGIVGAWSLDRLMGSEPKASRPPREPRYRREEKIGLVVGALMTLLALAVVVFHGRWGWAMRPQEATYPAHVIVALTQLRGEMLAKDLMVGAVLTTLVVGGLLLLSRRRLHPMLFGVVLVLATLGDLWRLDFIFLDIGRPTFAQAPPTMPSEVHIIRSDAGSDTLFRIAPVSGLDERGDLSVSATNEYGLWGLQSVSGYHAAILRIYDDLRISGGLSNRPVLDMLNVRYVIGPPGLSDPTLVPVNRGGTVVYRNSSALPRAWWVQTVTSAPTRKDALARVIDPGFDPGSEAVVIGARSVPEVSRPETTPRVTFWDFHRIVIQTDNDRQGFLVVSEVYYPHGWLATVDGQATEIFQTNYVLRGVLVPPGTHTVEFTYTSSAYTGGRILTAVLFPALIVVIAVETWRKRRKRGTTA